MEGECSMLVKQETPYKSVFIVAQSYARQYEGVLYEVKIEQGSGAIMGGRRGGALVGEEDRPPLIHPVNKIFGKSDMVPPHSCHLVAVRFNGLSKLYMLVTARVVPSHILRSTTAAATKLDLKGRIFDTETKSFDTFTHPKSFNRSSTLISAYNNLYHLGTPDSWCLGKPSIELERYDPCNDCWEPLTSVPFALYQGRGWIAGYAVYGNNILLSLSDDMGFIAFNVKENKWYPVLADQSFSFMGRAVVVGNTIYALSSHYRMFTKFSFDPTTYSIRETRRLVGFEFYKEYMSYRYFERRSEYMVHLGNLDFCLVQTATDRNCRDRQPIWVTTFQIVCEGGESSINTLHSTVYDVDLNGERNFLIGFSFTPDCEDNEPKGEETKGPLEKRCKRKGHWQGGSKLGIKPRTKIWTKRKSRKSLGLCLKRGLISVQL